jgi:cytolysin (calcineurin-like family phosphatase)
MLLKKLAALSALALVTLTAGIASAAPAPKVTVFNQGGYVADYQVSYVSNGQFQTMTTPRMVVGAKKTLTLPENSQIVSVKGQMYTGLFWEPKRQIFAQPAQAGSCFKTYGTIFKSNWSRQCTADF